MDFWLCICYSLISVSSMCMVLASNPINAVLFLIAIFFSGALLFILVGVDFIGLLLLTVYVGAIAVSFLFIVMMVNLKRLEIDRTAYLVLGISILVLVSVQISIVAAGNYLSYIPRNLAVISNIFSFDETDGMDESVRRNVLKRIGIMVFTEYPMLLIISGMLLLTAMIGSIYLTNTRKGYAVRRQYDQLQRHRTMIRSFDIYDSYNR